MTASRLLGRAWAAAIVAAGFGILYLAVAPVPGSHALDMALAFGISIAGGVVGSVGYSAIETRRERRQAEVDGTQTPAGVERRRELAAHGVS